VDIDLTSPDPTKRPVDIDLTVADPWTALSTREAAPAPRPDVAELLRADHTTGNPYRVPSSRAGRRRRSRWLDRKVRHAYGRLRRPKKSLKVERHIVVLAVAAAALAVLTTLAVGVRSKIGNTSEFVEISADLHTDPEVADGLARRLTNGLVAKKAVDPERALDVKLVLEDVIRSESFEPTWRAALRASHEEAFKGIAPTDLRIGKEVPGLGEDLEARELASGNLIRRATVSVVEDGYVAQLQSMRKLLNAILFLGVPLLVVITVVALRRTRNRYRAAGLMAGGTLVGAVAMLALAPLVAPVAVKVLIDDQAQALAQGALDGVLPSLRLLLLGLAIVAATLFVASRLEEVRVTPFVGSTRRNRNRRSHRSEHSTHAQLATGPDNMAGLRDGMV
jgi:hypothetical protein